MAHPRTEKERRPPLVPVGPKSHDRAREYRVLSKLAPHFSPAPHAYLLCEDLEVLGATFIVMERRRGSVVRFRVPPELDRVVLECLEKRPDQRVGSVDDLAGRLAGVPTTEPWSPVQARQWWDSNRVLVKT